jgi:hypothetical protein
MQGILTDNKKLKNLILENPDLPLLCFATEDANSGEWNCELASCRCHKGAVLDAKVDLLPRDDRVYTDEEDLEDDLRDALCDDYESLSDEEFDKMIDLLRKKYDFIPIFTLGTIPPALDKKDAVRKWGINSGAPRNQYDRPRRRQAPYLAKACRSHG